MAPKAGARSLLGVGATPKVIDHYAGIAPEEAGVSESDDEKKEKQLTSLQLMFEDDPEEAAGVVDDGVAARPADVRPVFLRVTVVDGVLARTKPGDCEGAVAYPIARHRVVMAVSRTSIRDKDLRMPVRWYRVNPAKKDADSVYKRGAGGGDARRGGWIRSMRRTVGMTEVVEATRVEYMEQVRRELDELEAVVDEASHALIEADTRHAVAYVSRAARLLERRGSLIEAFGAITAKVEVSMEARKATVEALKLELQLKAEGLGSAHADTTAMNSAQAVFVAGNREAMDKASKGDLRYKPMLVLKFLASFAATTHDPRGTLWTTLLGVLGKAKKIAASKHSSLRDDILVGLAAAGDVSAVRDLLDRDFCAAGGGANAHHSAAHTPALIAAVKRGAVDTVRALLEEGADVDATDELTHERPLHVAAARGDLPVVKCLLKFGADRYATVDDGFDELRPGPTANRLATEHGTIAKNCGKDDSGHVACAKVLRLEPPTVERVRVFSCDDRSVTIAWPIPGRHKSAVASYADELVEAYRVTAVQIGLAGHLATRVVEERRQKCVREASPHDYMITIHDLPSLQALDCTVAARTAGLYGRESARVLGFTQGRRPRPTGAPRLTRIARDSVSVEFTPIPLTGTDAISKGERKKMGAAFARMAPNDAYECQLCVSHPFRAGHDDPPNYQRNLLVLDAGDDDDDDAWVAYDSADDSDDEEKVKDPAWKFKHMTWVLHCVASKVVDADSCDAGGVEPPLVKMDGVRSAVKKFLLSWRARPRDDGSRGGSDGSDSDDDDDAAAPLEMPKLWLRARGRNRYGWGEFSKPTCVGRPREPLVKVLDKTTDSVTIAWDALDRSSCGYEVIYKTVSVTGGWSMHGSAHRMGSLHGVSRDEMEAGNLFNPRLRAETDNSGNLVEATLNLMKLDGFDDDDAALGAAGGKAVTFAENVAGGEVKSKVAKRQSGFFAVKTREDRDRQGRKREIQRRFNVSVPRARVPEKSTHVSRALREMIARPKISQNERKTTEIGAFEVGNFAPFSCPGDRARGRDYDDWTLVARDLTKQTYTIKRLRAGTFYDFRVRARPLIGEPHKWVHGASLRRPVATEPLRPEPPPKPTLPRRLDEDERTVLSGDDVAPPLTARGRPPMLGAAAGRAAGQKKAAEVAVEKQKQKKRKEEARLAGRDVEIDAGKKRRGAEVGRTYEDEGGLLGKCTTSLALPSETNGADVVHMELQVDSELVRDLGAHEADVADDGEDTTSHLVKDVDVLTRDAVPLLIFPGRRYTLRSRAKNVAGWSAWGFPITFDTPPGLPPPPLVVLERKQQLVRIRIDRPAPLDFRIFQRRELVRAGGALDLFAGDAGHRGSGERLEKLVAAEPTGLYEVEYRDVAKAREDPKVKWQLKSTTSKHKKLRLLLDHLTRGREYEIRSRARYAHGWSRWGDRLFTTTVT
ncbi:hypothetical protein SO694_000056117 [Aureococcus anophagefferens]|uniref:Fibronectin type-III domain-containing protein n=1 Tax=Aureococcus anophagefferens TaxID=44056 RepID=A0ABR1GAG3_AURAN